MKINRNNYELYFLDYLDGKLSDREILMLEDFLLINPDLRIELEGTENAKLFPDPLDFPGKDLLHRPDLSLPVTQENFQDFCVAATEGDLNTQEWLSLKQYLVDNPQDQTEFDLVRKLHLLPDNSIEFPAKEKLKKSLVMIPARVIYPFLAAAAGLAIFMVLYLNNENDLDTVKRLASETPASVINTDPAEKHNMDAALTPEKSMDNIQTASVISVNTRKNKKQAPVVKKNTYPVKKEEIRKKESIPGQKLNPSLQIKLPSIASAEIVAPVIEKGKITYSHVKPISAQPEYLNLSEYARKQLNEKILGANKQIDAWQLADAGLSGINKITGGEMKLHRQMDVDGNITSYEFNSKFVSFYTTARK